jgi:bile acid:Na+ symporter, BASS family
MFKLILRASPLVFLSWILVWWLNGLEYSGWILVAFWLFLGFGLRAKDELKPFSFPVAILGVVALAMFFPEYFQEA